MLSPCQCVPRVPRGGSVRHSVQRVLPAHAEDGGGEGERGDPAPPASLPPVQLHKVRSEDLSWLEAVTRHNTLHTDTGCQDQADTGCQDRADTGGQDEDYTGCQDKAGTECQDKADTRGQDQANTGCKDKDNTGCQCQQTSGGSDKEAASELCELTGPSSSRLTSARPSVAGPGSAKPWCEACRYCSQHICLATTVSLCAAITVLIIINIVLGFDPFLLILMFSLIFLLMTLLTG